MKHLILLITLLFLSACALAQDRLEEHYAISGSAECDSVLTLTTDATLDAAVYDSSGQQVAGTNMHPGDVWEVRLPTGRADYTLTVRHDGAVWSYDLREDCPLLAPTDEPGSHSLGEYLEQRGINLTEAATRGVVVTMIPPKLP